MPAVPVDQSSQLFTPQQIQEDANNRVARTGNQSVSAAALVVILSWYVQVHAHSVMGDVPTTVWASVQVLLTIGTAMLSNRKRVANLTADPAVVVQPVVVPPQANIISSEPAGGEAPPGTPEAQPPAAEAAA